MKLNTFQLRVSNSKVKQESLTLELVTRNETFDFFDFELVTRNVTFYFSVLT